MYKVLCGQNVCISLGTYLMEIAGSYVNSCLTLRGDAVLISKAKTASFAFHGKWCTRVLTSHLTNTSLFSFLFLMIANIEGMQWYLIMVLISTFFND